MSLPVFTNVQGAKSPFYKDAFRKAESNGTQMYFLLSPLTDQHYHYTYDGGWVLLMPGYPITFVKEKGSEDDFEDYQEDFKQDLGHIVDRYNYAGKLGRPRTWKSLFMVLDGNKTSFNDFLSKNKIVDLAEKRKIEVFISLLIGSINQASEVSLDVPQNLLDKIKNKIILFDNDQTKFLYHDPDKSQKVVRIQGLAGTGKTELLLHKIKDRFINEPDAIIGLTCHNKVLARVLKERLVSFFNANYVGRQIDTDKMKVFNAWGSTHDPDSGALIYICVYYELPFYVLRDVGNFDRACALTIENLKKSQKYKEGLKAFTYLFIDESQDFSTNFFTLCEMVTDKRVYAAGDIFQNIFKVVNSDDGVHVLLNHCYRTDPRTFMFAHGMGCSLFETKKVTWLKKEELEKCGYEVEELENGIKYRLGRPPVRRFEDIPDDYKSISIFKTNQTLKAIFAKIDEWRNEFANLTVDDIGIIFVDEAPYIYDLAQNVAEFIERRYGWKCNIAHVTKRRKRGELFISNRNNVKGLEFPFVICISKEIDYRPAYRHTLYTMLSRSHLHSSLILQELDSELQSEIITAVNEIVNTGRVTINVPSAAVQKQIAEQVVNIEELHYSIEERVRQICQEYGFPERSVKKFLDFTKGKLNENMTDNELRDKIDGLRDYLEA